MNGPQKCLVFGKKFALRTLVAIKLGTMLGNMLGNILSSILAGLRLREFFKLR